MQAVKLSDVASAAGVHPGTASRALNPETRDQVSAGTVRRVELAAQRLGYVPNTLARGLRTARSYMVGMLVPDITNPLFPPMVRGAEKVLSGADYTLVLTDTENDPRAGRRQLESLRARGTGGFIVATASWEDPLLDELADAAIPTVLLNRNTASRRLPYVGGDERTGIELAVAHLVDLGHRELAYVAGPHDTSTGRERTSAFRAAVRRHGLPAEPRRVRAAAAYAETAGADAMRRMITAGPPFTAVLAGNDLIALGVMTVLAEAGLRCPQDVSLVGFNDLPLVDKLTPALTTVRLPLHAMGALAATTLLEEIEHPHAPGRVAQSLLGVELAVRASTGPPPGRD